MATATPSKGAFGIIGVAPRIIAQNSQTITSCSTDLETGNNRRHPVYSSRNINSVEDGEKNDFSVGTFIVLVITVVMATLLIALNGTVLGTVRHLTHSTGRAMLIQ
jgi:hypothetical protein